MSSLVKWKWRSVRQPIDSSEPAVYAVRLLNRGKVIPITRFLGVDIEGILTIGMSTNIKRRCKQFNHGHDKGRGHSAANILNFLRKKSKAYKSKLSDPSFEIAYKVVADRSAAIKLEEILTRRYLKRFGEVPPLTSVIPKRYDHLLK